MRTQMSFGMVPRSLLRAAAVLRRHPVLIDHAASFRKEAFVSMDHENAFRTGPVRTVSAKTYLRLRFFDARWVPYKPPMSAPHAPACALPGGAVFTLPARTRRPTPPAWV